MTPEQREAFREYEELKTEERLREKRLKELKEIIMPLVPDDQELKGAAGVFYIQNRNTWAYSPVVKGMEKELKELKSREEATGTAKATKVPALYYRSSKEEEE